MVCMLESLKAGRGWWSGARKPGRMTFGVGGRAEGVARGAVGGGRWAMGDDEAEAGKIKIFTFTFTFTFA